MCPCHWCLMLLVVFVRPPLPCCPLLLVSVCVIAVCAVTVCVVICRVFVLLLLLLWWRLARSPPITRPGSARATPRISLWCAGSPAHHPGTSRFCSMLFCCAADSVAICLLLSCRQKNWGKRNVLASSRH